MSKKSGTAVIGAFVLAGIAMMLVATVLLGGRFFTKDSAEFVLYFNGSVKGLRIGAPVSFRGARVGTVKDVALEFNDSDISFRIPVEIEIDSGLIGWSEKRTQTAQERRDLVTRLIDGGLRAQLSLESFVTGQLFIQLDFFPNKPAVLVGSKKGLPEIPTIASSLDLLTQRVAELPLADVVSSFQNVVKTVDEIVSSSAVKDTVTRLPVIVTEIQETVVRIGASAKEAEAVVRPLRETLTALQTQITSLGEEANKTIKEGRSTIVDARDSLHRGAEKLDPLSFQVERTLKDLTRAGRAVETLANTLERKPESLLRGK